MAFIDIRKEVIPLKEHKEMGLRIIKAKEKLVINSSEKEVYIELYSFSIAVGIKSAQILEEISYNQITKEYLAYYRDGQKLIKLLDVNGLDVLIRNLMAAGYDIGLLKNIRNQIKYLIKLMEKE